MALKWLPYLSAIASGVWAFAGAFPEILPVPQRLGIACIVALLIAGGAFAHWRQRDRRKDVAAELGRISDLDEALTKRAMESLAEVLFKRHAVWRLTVFAVEMDNDDAWQLRPLMRRSAHQAYERTGRQEIRLDRSILRSLWNVSLPHGEATGEAPDPVNAPEDWESWQAHFLQDAPGVKNLHMKSRRYAWCAAREKDRSERTIALVAETLEPDGIILESLDSPLIYSSMLMIARWSELRREVGTAALAGKALLEAAQR